MTAREVSESVKLRFWSKVDKGDIDACWPWTGPLNREGRGRFTIDGRTYYAYRLALILSGDRVEPGRPVRHLCGNSSCCRPDHLSSKGGQRENNLDTVAHGRHRSAKLDAKTVRQMRERYADDRQPLSSLADVHGVTEQAISDALTGRTWSRAGGPLKRSRKGKTSRPGGAP